MDMDIHKPDLIEPMQRLHGKLYHLPKCAAYFMSTKPRAEVVYESRQCSSFSFVITVLIIIICFIFGSCFAAFFLNFYRWYLLFWIIIVQIIPIDNGLAFRSCTLWCWTWWYRSPMVVPLTKNHFQCWQISYHSIYMVVQNIFEICWLFAFPLALCWHPDIQPNSVQWSRGMINYRMIPLC